MFEARIEAADPSAVDRVARQCGVVAVGCSKAGGVVGRVADSISGQIAILNELQAVMASLQVEQRQATDATDEARLLTESARTRLAEGGRTIAASIAEFGELTALVLRLGQQISSFASAMQQVRRTADVIDTIARTTNMLALNAAIEAERAGDAGRTFAVVAAEVKKLALDTRVATEEIGTTMDSLAREGEGFLTELQDGMTRSRAAEAKFSRVTETVGDVTRLVDQVDAQAADIARATNMIHQSVCRVGNELEGFSVAASANNTLLGSARGSMVDLEQQANEMFDTMVHSGFALADQRLVAIAVAERDAFVSLTEQAIAEGKLDMETLFDSDYRPIPGSNPERFDTRLNAFADRYWRPELDRIRRSDPQIISTACSDRNGYRPTHTSEYSRKPTGDPNHDAAYCRDRRIMADATDLIAKASIKPFHVAVYRRESEDGGFNVVRNIYVPFFIDGKRWGDLEVAYR